MTEASQLDTSSLNSISLLITLGEQIAAGGSDVGGSATAL